MPPKSVLNPGKHCLTDDASTLDETAKLPTLFSDVDSFINKFIEIEANKDKDENEIRCFVAGHVCFEILDEFQGDLLSHVLKKYLGLWNIFKSSFKDKELMAQLAHDFKLLKESHPEMLKRLEDVAARKNKRSMKADMRFRYYRFKIDWGIMKKISNTFATIIAPQTRSVMSYILLSILTDYEIVAAQEASQKIQSWEKKERSLHTAGVDHSNHHLLPRSCSTSRSPPHPASRSPPPSASRSTPRSASGSCSYCS
ncbi:hypothetical protein [Parasitella parasitica]|uniref:Uncharacterized protein n=1 Tax=Parasitella parasitica TaxID=35722 RepID=A0A0B7NVL2_9FUNG|nr:hypothetical protein [Parasitella parasitica]